MEEHNDIQKEVTVQNETANKNDDGVVLPAKKKKRRLEEYTLKNDIKFKGVFSYRHLRIFGWVFFAVSQAVILLSLAGRIDPQWLESQSGLMSVLSVIGGLALPLFLFAAFAEILHAKDGYKKAIINYSIMSLSYIAVFMFIYYHYGVGVINTFVQDRGASKNMAELILNHFAKNGYITFNVFIDLLLCALFTFFINYTPKSKFKGKKIILFRLLSVIPVIYETTCILLKGFASTEVIKLPIWIYPFLTTKPPMMFLMFVALAFFIKNRERIFRKRGKTHAEYKEFLKTNANSLHFSVFSALIIFVAALIDFLLLIVISVIIEDAGDVGSMMAAVNWAFSIGIGRSIIMVLSIPFVLLFSYTKTHKNNQMDIFVSFGGIALTAFVYLEGLYQLLNYLVASVG